MSAHRFVVRDARRRLRMARAAAGALVGLLLTCVSGAQAQNPSGSQTAPVFQLPPVIVSAQKEPADARDVPAGLTAVSAETIEDARIEIPSDAAIYAPNVHFTEFSARKLSNARFRGIGASPANPSITTYLDGVPQLNANSSSVDLLQVDQIEFVRGPQSALFGRNALGGIINVTSRRPPLGGDWAGSAVVPIASHDDIGVRVAAAGPVVGNRLGAGAAFWYGERDGYTQNIVTGRGIDSRSSYSGKAQLLWAPASRFEARLIVSGERDRDGDYALSDLGGLRSTPFVAARDFEGYTERDVKSATVLVRWDAARVGVTSTTGFTSWRTEDATDLDYSALPLVTRENREESVQFTQELRVASAPASPVALGNAAVRWQAGVFLFTQQYQQDATNTFGPFVVDPSAGFAISQTSPRSDLDDVGVGVYGQGTVTVGRVDLTAGVRADYEQRDAVLDSFTTPALPFFPPTSVTADRSFSDVSPQFAGAVRMAPGVTAYGSLTRGFKAGGFNAASPIGSDVYDEEHTWGVEGGVKATWADGRLTASAAVFRIDWQDLQLNLPNPAVPGQFFIANAGSAVSSGVEFEAAARAMAGLDVFGAVGYTHARFDEGVLIGATDVGGHEIPNTPDFTATVGAQVTQVVRPGLLVYARAEASVHGAFFYDEANTEAQDTYALASFRGGARFGLVFVEAWIRNAFDTHYIPVAFAYDPRLAPSGFIGEMGRPRTFGIGLGVAY